MAELYRCWLGFPLPSSLAEKLKDAQMQVRRRAGGDTVRWTAPGEFALFLVSLGELANTSILRVQGILDEVVKRHPPMELAIEGVMGSPNATMPKSVVAGVVGDNEALKKLRADLAVCVQQFVTAIDEKPFEPAIELGVLRKFDDRARTEMGRAIKMSGVGELGGFRMDAVHVLASHATTAGPSLNSVAHAPLAQ
jgi:2'-5' RNA ligase